VESTAAWGGQLELQALATGLRVPIEVFTANAPSVTMGESYVGENGGAALRVCHHRHAFGLGEHYNSAADA
jgi:OTU domain-containing protein 6